MVKFFDEKTMMARSSEYHDKLHLPPLAICPGFKAGAFPPSNVATDEYNLVPANG